MKPFAVLGLFAALLAGSGCLYRSTGADPVAPAPDVRQQAEEEYERLLKEVYQTEEVFKEERVRARLELTEVQERLRALDREHGAMRQAELAELVKLQDKVTEVQRIATPDNPILADLQKRIAVLEAKEKDRQPVFLKAHRAVMMAEEEMRLLERKHELGRRKYQAKMDALEMRMAPEKTDTSDALKRRMEKMDAKLDDLLRDMAELRKAVKAKDSE